jgi:hypothetical protein
MAAQFALRSNRRGGHLLPPKCAAGSRIIWDISGASEQLPANLVRQQHRSLTQPRGGKMVERVRVGLLKHVFSPFVDSLAPAGA